MARGRRPQPAAIKELKGNPGRRPIAPETAPAGPLSDDALTAAPEWLEGEAKEIWGRLAPDLMQMRLLQRPDVPTFARYCQWFARWLDANRSLSNGGLVVQTKSEHVEMDRLSKYLQAALLIEKRLVDIEDRFGLNPANRQRIFMQRAAGGGAGAGTLPFGEGKTEDKPPAGGEAAKPAAGGGAIGLLN